MFNQQLFIFNPNLGVDLPGQLLLKYKVKFDKFGFLESSDRKIFIHMWITRFGYYLVSQFDDFDRGVHFGIFLIIYFY